MKKQKKIVLGILVAVVVIIIGLAINFPPVFKGTSSGTFTKADKYQKSQMTENDVKLRSELTADTARLKKTIQGLIYFTAFTEDLCLRIDTCVNVFQEKGMNSEDPGFSALAALRDYAGFIRNSNQTLGKTIGMLSSFYMADVKDQSQDVEKNLLEFSNYVKLFAEKDEVLEAAITGMDNYIVGSKILKDRKDELRKLKSIRDQLLIKGIQVAGLNQDKGLCAILLNTSLDNLGLVYVASQSGKDLNVITGLNSSQSLSGLFNSSIKAGVTLGLGSIFNSTEQMQAAVVYDRPNLQFVTVAASQIQAVLVNSTQVVGIVYTGTAGLNVANSNFDLKTGYSGIAGLNATQLGSVINGIMINSNADLCRSMTGMVTGMVTGMGSLAFHLNSASVINSR